VAAAVVPAAVPAAGRTTFRSSLDVDVIVRQKASCLLPFLLSRRGAARRCSC
jgi:hypothetical protein